MSKDRFVRGSVKSLGKEYTKERIKERIELKRERKAVIPKRDYANRKLVLLRNWNRKLLPLPQLERKQSNEKISFVHVQSGEGMPIPRFAALALDCEPDTSETRCPNTSVTAS